MMPNKSGLNPIAIRPRFIAIVILVNILIVSLLVVIPGCAATSSVVSVHDPNQDFTAYRNYAWLDYFSNSSNDRDISSLALTRIKNAIDINLAAKDYALADSAETADFLISFSVGLEERMEQYMSSAFLDDDSEITVSLGWGDSYYEPGAMVDTYQEGSLAIDVFDAGDRTPIWHGYAKKRIEPADQQDDGGQSIRDGVNAIMATFPPE